MRIDETTRFWVVTEPNDRSEMADIMFETTLDGFIRQVNGGLNIREHSPVIFTEKEEAEREARSRLVAHEAKRLVLLSLEEAANPTVIKIALIDENGATIQVLEINR